MVLVYTDIVLSLNIAVGILVFLLLLYRGYDRRKLGRYRAATSFFFLAFAVLAYSLTFIYNISFITLPESFLLILLGVFILLLFLFISMGLNIEQYVFPVVVIFVLVLGALPTTPPGSTAFASALQALLLTTIVVGIATTIIFFYMYLKIKTYGPFSFGISILIPLFLFPIVEYIQIFVIDPNTVFLLYLLSLIFALTAALFGAERSLVKGLSTTLGIMITLHSFSNTLYSTLLNSPYPITILYFGLGIGNLGLAVLVGTFIKKYQRTGDTLSYMMGIGLLIILLNQIFLFNYFSQLYLGYSFIPFPSNLYYLFLLGVIGLSILLYGLLKIFKKEVYNNFLIAYVTAIVFFVIGFENSNIGPIYPIIKYTSVVIVSIAVIFSFVYAGLKLLRLKEYGCGTTLGIGLSILLFLISNMALFMLKDIFIAGICSMIYGAILLLVNSGYLDKFLLRAIKR